MNTFYPTNFFPTTTVIEGITIVNLTPHPLNIIGLEGTTRTYDPSGYSVRVSTSSGGQVGVIGSVHVPMFEKDEVGELILVDQNNNTVCPLSEIPVRDDMVLIVSGLAGSKQKDRQDVFVPCTSPSDNPVRNDAGHIVAVRGIKKP